MYTSSTRAQGRTRHSVQRQGATSPASPLILLPAHRNLKTQPGGRPPQKEERRGEEKKTQKKRESMELCVSTTASARATAAPFAPLRRGACSVTAVPLRRRLPARGWRCASAAVPEPLPSEEPASASSTVVVTDKPDAPADEKAEEVSAASSVSAEVTVAELVSSEASPSPDDGGLDDILSKLNIEVTPTLILTGSGAFVALWILSSIVSAIDSVPLLPKFLELVGTGYSIWFVTRYLLFKESRDDLFGKFEDLKQRII
ncbi:hypothetical protein BAE44_0011681 [Dichanthelium oligosanthes]|uniref:Cyanobacterial aminoacyl-tRNA synthetase CAAD domain-containing protein n=1 Tax=Dichanthelium oligosanthes TaxID=888268 RepID=A0A1E5VQC7_9POAL|nr:hypothetical protein BAE44_0011681 [Dichanthelium oligosanthes]